MPLNLPSPIVRFVDGAALVADKIGESPCSVSSFRRGNDRFFLKWSPSRLAATTYGVLREASVLDWLSGRLAVPEVVMTAEDETGQFMVTRALPGEPLFRRIDDGLPVRELFQEALRLVAAVPANGCPFDSTIPVRLEELAYLIDEDLIADDYDLCQWPDSGPAPMDPPGLLRHLQATRPAETPLFSHGDLCDSNIFLDDRDRLAFIDLGRGGLADPWLDIAFVYRNLREEVSEAEAELFLSSLDRPDDPARRLYFEQLDELF